MFDLASYKGAEHAIVGTQRYIVIKQHRKGPLEIPVTSQDGGNVLVRQIHELSTNPELVEQANKWLAHVGLTVDQYLEKYAHETPPVPARTVQSEQDLITDENTLN